MPFYEHVLLLRQDIQTAQAEGHAADLAKVIEDNGGKVTKTEYWGLKTLAYKIKKNRKAHYLLMNIDAPHPAVAEMERLERLNEDVLRFMTVRVEALEEGPSIIIQNKNRGDRDHRGHRGDRDRGPRGDRDRGPRGDRGDRGDRKPREDRPAREEKAS